MRSIIEVLNRVKGILSLMEIRQTEYNQAAYRECICLIDAVIEAMKKAIEKTEQEEPKT